MKTSIFEKQVFLLMRLLPLIEQESNFALKGGTAINYFHRNMPRFSVDIDLTYLPLIDRQNTLKNISEALHRISVITQKTMSDVRVVPKLEKSLGNILKLIVTKKEFSVKIEPNLILHGSVFGTEKMSLCEKAQNSFQLNIQLNTLSFADLYGGKICAALDRQHPRDLFDIKLLLENEGLTDSIRKAFIAYLISHNRPMSELLNPNFIDVEPVFNNEFMGMTFIPITLEELMADRQTLLQQIHSNLTDAEKKFILSVKELSPDWKKLGLDGIDKLPGVQWKLQNLRQMSKKKHAESVVILKEVLKI